LGPRKFQQCEKVLWCAEELRLPYERVDAGGPHGIVETQTFGKINPNRRVPVLEDEELVLWESNAIVRYLAARYGAGRLWSADPKARASADRWMDWTSISFGPPFVTVFFNLMRQPPDKRDHSAVERATEAAGQLLHIADAALSVQPFLSGSEFGMGDIPLGCLIHAWFNMNIARPSLVHVSKWYERLLEMSAYNKVVALPLS
jgi:glutathione S-transferase